MTAISSSTMQCAFIEEVTWNTTPATPEFQILRRTGGNLRTKKMTVVSEEVRADRNVPGEFQVAQDVVGSYNFELTEGTLDSFLKSALQASWSTDVLINGTNPLSFSIEEKVGGSGVRSVYSGCYVDKMSLDLSSRKLVTGSVDFIGGLETLRTTAISGATYDAANTNTVLSADMTTAFTVLGNTPIVKNLKINISNNGRIRDQVGSLYTADPGWGPADVTGTMDVYFEDNTFLTSILAHATGSVTFKIGATANHRYKFTMPNVQLLDGARTLGGKNDDVMIQLPFRACYNSGIGGSIKIERNIA